MYCKGCLPRGGYYKILYGNRMGSWSWSSSPGRGARSLDERARRRGTTHRQSWGRRRSSSKGGLRRTLERKLSPCEEGRWEGSTRGRPCIGFWWRLVAGRRNADGRPLARCLVALLYLFLVVYVRLQTAASFVHILLGAVRGHFATSPCVIGSSFLFLFGLIFGLCVKRQLFHPSVIKGG